MLRLLKADLVRLLRDRGILVVAIILIGFCLLSVGLAALIGYMLYSIDFPELSKAVSFSYPVGQMVADAGAIGSLGLFTAIAVGLYNGADFKNLTVRNKITAGCSRDVIYFSTFIVNQILNLALFIIAALATFAFGAIMLDFDFSSTFAADFAMTYLISAAFTAIMTFLSFLTKKTSWTILTGVLISVLMPSIFGSTALYYFSLYSTNLIGGDASYGALEWLSRLNLFSMNTFISAIGNGSLETTFSGITWGGFSYNAYVGWLYGNAAITSLVWGGCAAIGGMLLFRRTDIK